MKETHRISKLFSSLYDGHPWIYVNIYKTFQSINAKQASQKLFTGGNSIWQIIDHLLKWRQNIYERVHGMIVESPADNYFTEITDTSGKSWNKLLKDFAASQEQWLHFIQTADESLLEKIDPLNEFSFYEFIQGIIQHDAYHLGQISMLAKQVKQT
ncbi:MAG: DinB family protein [Ferruginibacter sp.]